MSSGTVGWVITLIASKVSEQVTAGHGPTSRFPSQMFSFSLLRRSTELQQKFRQFLPEGFLWSLNPDLGDGDMLPCFSPFLKTFCTLSNPGPRLWGALSYEVQVTSLFLCHKFLPL